MRRPTWGNIFMWKTLINLKIHKNKKCPESYRVSTVGVYLFHEAHFFCFVLQNKCFNGFDRSFLSSLNHWKGHVLISYSSFMRKLSFFFFVWNKPLQLLSIWGLPFLKAHFLLFSRPCGNVLVSSSLSQCESSEEKKNCTPPIILLLHYTPPILLPFWEMPTSKIHQNKSDLKLNLEWESEKKKYQPLKIKVTVILLWFFHSQNISK